ncbi:hypothetical protein ACHAWF_017336 [Thalassiosira exigua]
MELDRFTTQYQRFRSVSSPQASARTTRPLTDGPSRRLEESEHEVHRDDEEVPQVQAEAQEVEPQRDVDQEQARPAPEQPDRQDGRGVERVSQLAGDDVPRRVGPHEDGVHLGEDEGGIARDALELLLHGGVALAGEVGHEVAPEGDEEGPSGEARAATRPRASIRSFDFGGSPRELSLVGAVQKTTSDSPRRPAAAAAPR